MIKVVCSDVWVMSNPAQLNFNTVNACEFIVGSNDHKSKVSTTIGWVKTVALIRCYGHLAAFAYEQLRKGDQCYIEGRLFQRAAYRKGTGEFLPHSHIKAERILQGRRGDSAEIVVLTPELDRMIEIMSEMWKKDQWPERSEDA